MHRTTGYRFTEIVKLEKGTSALHLGLDKSRRCHFRVLFGEEMVTKALRNRRPSSKENEQSVTMLEIIDRPKFQNVNVLHGSQQEVSIV